MSNDFLLVDIGHCRVEVCQFDLIDTFLVIYRTTHCVNAVKLGVWSEDEKSKVSACVPLMYLLARALGLIVAPKWTPWVQTVPLLGYQ